MTEVARKLTEIDNLSVESNITYSGGQTIYRVRLPYVPIFRSEYENGDISPHLDYLNVPYELRRNRIATRLVSSMAWILNRDGHQLMHSEVSSVYTINIFGNLFGRQSLIFRDLSGTVLPVNKDTDVNSLDISENNKYDVTVNIINPVQDLEEPREANF